MGVDLPVLRSPKKDIGMRLSAAPVVKAPDSCRGGRDRGIQQVREQVISSEDLEALGVKPGLRMVVARMLSLVL